MKTSPGIFILFQEKSKDPSEATPALIFGHKIDPPTPPHRMSHRPALRKIFDEKEAPNNEDSKSVYKNVLSHLVLPQFKKQILVILL